MGSNLVIVAIPKEGDRVWKISSEKVPHLTILHLGDSDQISNLDQIMQFVEHAANTSLCTFWLPVDHRGELGEAKADVLFFKKGRYDFKAIRDFRSLLLKDHNVKSAYDAAQQFETPPEVGQPGQPWIPHLTLGYPETPAKPMTDEYNDTIYDVNFDRIGVWPGDFEGPEFRLKDYWEEFDEMDVPLDVAMSDIAHYGVKGMRWGVRNNQGGSNTSGVGETKREGIQRYLDPTGHQLSTDVAKSTIGALVPIVAPLAIPANVRLYRGAARGIASKHRDNQDKKFERTAKSQASFVAIHNGASDHINKSIAEINKKYPGDISKSPAKQKAYDAEVLKAMQDGYRDSANRLGNKRGTKHLDVEFLNDGTDFKIHVKDGMQKPTEERVKHAAEDDGDESITLTGKLNRASTGHILGVTFADLEPKTVEHTMDLGEEFLEHYGVKGMRWGVRKGALQQRIHENRVNTEATRREKRPAREVRTYDTIGTSKKQKSSIDAKGGEDHPPTPDAIKVAASQQKMKKSGLKALSNQELQEMERRLNLEASVKRLTEGQKTSGQKFVDGILGRGSDKDRKSFESQAGQRASQEIVKAATPHVVRAVRKHAVGI